MAVSGRLDIRHSIDAAADLSASQYRFVWFDGDGQAVAATAGGPGLILVDKPTREGEGAAVILVGKSKVEAGGNIAAGASLAAGAAGVAVTAGAGTRVNAIALEDGVAGQVITCLVVAPVAVVPA
jgi:hypothetical protein